MEPATFYMLFTIANGPERMSAGHFGSKALCENHQALVIERKPATFTIIKSVCWEHGTPAPKWIVEPVINGVPLEPKYRP